MNCDKNKEMIQLYSDGELEKGKEINLFTHLSECEECRLFFRSFNKINLSIEKKDFPHALETRIFDSISSIEFRKENKLFNKIFARPTAYALAIVFIAASIFFYEQANNYKTETGYMRQQIKSQTQTIDLLYNTLPPTVVHAAYDHEIIIKAKM